MRHAHPDEVSRAGTLHRQQVLVPSPGLGQPLTVPVTELHIGTFTRSLLIEVAQMSGSFKRVGLDIKQSLVASSRSQFQALEAGHLDLVMTSPDNALAYRFIADNALGRNLPVQIIAAIDRGLGLSLCMAPQFQNIESVRSQVLGVDAPESGFALVAYALLEKAVLPPGDYQVQSIGSTPLRTDALVAGHCAASVLNAGNELRATGLGCTQVNRVTDLGPYIGTVLAAMESEDAELRNSHLRFADVLLETAEEIQAGRWESEIIEKTMELLELTESHAQAHHTILLDPIQELIPSGVVDGASIGTVMKLRREYLPSVELGSIQTLLGTLVIDRAIEGEA